MKTGSVLACCVLLTTIFPDPVHLLASPNIRLIVVREDNKVTASWPRLFKKYTKIQIKFCPREGGSCVYHDVADPTSLQSSFPVKEGKSYKYFMIIFDGDDQEFVLPVVAPTPMAAIGDGVPGGVGGFLVVLLVIIPVMLATAFMHKKRRAKKDGGREATGSTDTLQTSANAHDHVMNVVNRAFESDEDALNHGEPFYVNFPQNLPPVQEVLYDETMLDPSAAVPAVAKKKIQDLSVEDFKQWLLSNHVTESTYQILAKNELDKAVVFALLEREDIKALRIKAIGQEILVRNLVESFRSGAETKMGDGRRPRSGDAKEGAYMEIENPYEELNITPDVIADQVYAKIKPWAFSRADC